MHWLLQSCNDKAGFIDCTTYCVDTVNEILTGVCIRIKN